MKIFLLFLGLFAHLGKGDVQDVVTVEQSQCSTNPRLRNAIKSSMNEVLQGGSNIGNH